MFEVQQSCNQPVHFAYLAYAQEAAPCRDHLRPHQRVQDGQTALSAQRKGRSSQV